MSAVATRKSDAGLQEPRVRTALPGPASAKLLARQNERESNARTYPRRLTIAPRRGVGSYIEDVDGDLRPVVGHHQVLHLEDQGSVSVDDARGPRDEGGGGEGVAPLGRVAACDVHVRDTSEIFRLG